jgi:lipid-A-disaccharide synthase-like uncharacterized protein
MLAIAPLVDDPDHNIRKVIVAYIWYICTIGTLLVLIWCLGTHDSRLVIRIQNVQLL